MKIQAADDQQATVYVQGRELGVTGEVLSFDISEYRRPIFLDVTLSRPGFVPTLHALEVKQTKELWQPPPLPLLKRAQDVTLRVEPPATRLYREKKDGSKEPAGQNSELTLEVVNLPIGKAFRPTEVTVHLEREGYVSSRLVLPAEIWFSKVYPNKDQDPLKLLAAPGWKAWWTRYSQERPIALVVGFCSIILLAALGWLRFHYLRQIEAAHLKLSRWVERLDIFVEGSRELASPLLVEELAKASMLQAKRLCGSDWEAFHCSNPDHTNSSEPEVLDKLSELSEFFEQKRHPLRLDDLSDSRFKTLSGHGNSLLGQPLLFKGEYYGLLVLGGSDGSKFSATDQEALEVLASQVAASIERIRLHQETVVAYQKLTESEAQLIQSAKMAAVGQLAAGVAHELNTPLNAITFGIEMADANVEKHPARTKKRLALVMNAAQRATGIVKKLLYYSREATVDENDFALNTLVQDTVEFLKFQMDQDVIELAVVGEMDCPLRGNLNELSQVLSNLILNARDSILKGEYEKRIVIEVRDRVNSVEILVQDKAGGISQEIQDKIFDPFFTTKNLGEGTGLGLSVSQKIMEKHGGELRLESAHEPCSFCMRLPKCV